MKHEHHNSPSKTLRLAAFLSTSLALLKFLGFCSTGSLIILASFFDSLSDAATSFINNYIYKKSVETADKEHPFGHGGFEVLGALIQGILILFFSVNVLVESFRELSKNAYEPLDQASFALALGVMLLSALASFLIHQYLHSHVQKLKKQKERSLILMADRAHYSGDVYTNLGSALALVVVHYSHLHFLDPIIGGISAIFLGSLAIPVLRKSFNDIAHNEAPEEFQQMIVNIVLSVDKKIKGIHMLRSRELGPYLFVDFHLKLPDKLSLKEAHAIGEKTEYEIKKVFKNADVFIHLDPESEPDQEQWNPSYKLPE